MTTQPHHDSNEIDPAEYARRADEALGALSTEDKLLIDGVRFKILQDVDERIGLMKRLHVIDVIGNQTLFIWNICRDLKARQDRAEPKRATHEVLNTALLALLLVAMAFLATVTANDLWTATERNRRLQRGVLVVKAAIAEADQLWCRYDLSQALHSQHRGQGEQVIPQVSRPDEARLGTRPGHDAD